MVFRYFFLEFDFIIVIPQKLYDVNDHASFLSKSHVR